MDVKTATVLYNLMMSAGDVAVLLLVYRKMPRWVTFAGLIMLALMGLVGALMALKLGENKFGVLRLLSYGIFLHGFIVLSGLAILWRQGFRKMAAVAAAAAFLLGAIAIDAFTIEPYWLEVSRVQLSVPKLDKPLKIVVVADFQTDVWGEYERQALRLTVAEKPDLILLPGDYLQVSNPQQREVLRRQFNSFLKEIGLSAPLGVYAVGGDTEYFTAPKNWPQNFEGLPVTVFADSKRLVLPQFCLTGLTLSDSRNSQLKIPECDRFHIAFGHAPDFALGDVQADLLIAGHTHGGQVRLPLLGPVITLSKVPRKWAAGVTDLGNNRTLIVSRGVGMERGHAPRLRFLCRPELVVVDLLPTQG